MLWIYSINQISEIIRLYTVAKVCSNMSFQKVSLSGYKTSGLERKTADGPSFTVKVHNCQQKLHGWI